MLTANTSRMSKGEHFHWKLKVDVAAEFGQTTRVFTHLNSKLFLFLRSQHSYKVHSFHKTPNPLRSGRGFEMKAANGFEGIEAELL